MTILSFFTLNNPIRRLWTNLYHKEDHFSENVATSCLLLGDLFKNL